MVESVDTPDLKSCGLTAVRVQVPPRAPFYSVISPEWAFFVFNIVDYHDSHGNIINIGDFHD